MKFGILWLFSLTFVIGVLLAIATYSLQLAFLSSCVSLGSFAGFLARSQFRSSHKFAVLVVFTTSSVIGGSFLAAGSYFHTFIEPSIGYLVGDGWRSVGSSFIVGSVVGAFTSLLAVLAFAALSGLFDIYNSDSAEQ